MNIRFSISLKLLLLILPLVCLPVTIVGYFSIYASAQRVNRLVRQEQMALVRVTADKINDIFNRCRIDLKTIAGLPVIEDYIIARSFRLRAETEFNHDKIRRLFKDFVERTPYYRSIRFLDNAGRELIAVRSDGSSDPRAQPADAPFFNHARSQGRDHLFVSDIERAAPDDGYQIHWASAVFSAWEEFAGVVAIDLDFDRLLRIVENVRVGAGGYAFMVDDRGRLAAHPRYRPYALDLETYPEPSLHALARKMAAGGSALATYRFDGEEKVAAFAPIQGLKWSLAVTIPTAEFMKEARAVRTRVLQVVFATLLFALAGVSILSYFMLRPVRNLVTATQRLATGDLRQEIPVESRDELGELTRTFNAMLKNLAKSQDELVRSEKLISLGRLSAGMAHEIRNPLNAMKGAVALLQRRRPEDPLIVEYTRLIAEEIDRLNVFVTEFLYFARQSPPRLEATDLNRLVLMTQRLFTEQAQNKGVRFHNRLSAELPPVPADANQVEQVLVNVLINALDALPDGGDITFSTAVVSEGDAADPAVRLEIRDNGAGIPPAELKNIFDPFFSTKDTGTGLGLPLSLGIIENHGGRITVTPRETTGTKVTIELPLTAHRPKGGTNRA